MAEVNRYERIFAATGGKLLPVRLRNIRISKPFQSAEVMLFNFTAPCPCKSWKHDTKTAFRATTTRPDWVSMREQYRFIKYRLRTEAASHAREFISCGTIDGLAM
jgi:hypothetical protein